MVHSTQLGLRRSGCKRDAVPWQGTLQQLLAGGVWCGLQQTGRMHSSLAQQLTVLVRDCVVLVLGCYAGYTHTPRCTTWQCRRGQHSNTPQCCWPQASQVTRFFPALSTHACRVTASCRLGVSHATSSALEAVVAVHGYLAPQVLFASVGRQGSTVASTCVSAGAVKG